MTSWVDVAFLFIACMAMGFALAENQRAFRYQQGYEAARAAAEAESRLCQRRHVNHDFVCHWRHNFDRPAADQQ